MALSRAYIEALRRSGAPVVADPAELFRQRDSVTRESIVRASPAALVRLRRLARTLPWFREESP